MPCAASSDILCGQTLSGARTMTVSFPERFNMAGYYLDNRIDEGLGDRVAVYYEDKRFTYRDVQQMANRAGNALRGLGVEMEDRVLIVLPDSIEFVATWFGVAKIGAIAAMVNTVLPTSDYEYYLDYTRAKVAVVHASVMAQFAPAAARSRYLRYTIVPKTIASGRLEGLEQRSRVVSYEKITSTASDELENADTSVDDIAIWLFTSGSTGNAKAAVHLQHDLPYNTECYAKRVLGINRDDVTLSVPKLFFGYATGTNLLFPFAVGGATALFPGRSTAETMFEMIDKHRPTILTSVPTMINAM